MTLSYIGPAQYDVRRSFKRLLSPHSRDFFRGSLSRRTAASEIDNRSFHLAVVILDVYRSVLNRDPDNANFDPLHTHDLIREFHATLCLTVHKLLETGVLNVLSDADDLATPSLDLSHSDEHISRRTTPAVCESKHVFKELTLVYLGGAFESILRLLEIQRLAFRLMEQMLKEF